MLLSKMPFWPGATVKTRVPVSTVVAPAGGVGNVGIGGSDPIGRTDALGDALRGGVAVAEAVAAGVTVGRTLDVALEEAEGRELPEGDADVPGTFRSVSAPQADVNVTSANTSTSRRLRG